MCIVDIERLIECLKNVRCLVNICKLLFCNWFFLFNSKKHFLAIYATVKKNGKLGLHGGKNLENRVWYSAFVPVFHFVRLQPRNFGASISCTGIKVYSLGINTYCLQERSKWKYLNTCIVNDNPFKKYLSFNHSFIQEIPIARLGQ